MLCSGILVLIGIVALVKGEIKITSKHKVTGTVSRVLAILLIAGSILGAIFEPIITFVTFFLVIFLGVIALFFEQDTTDNKVKVEDIYQSNDPYKPISGNSSQTRFTPAASANGHDYSATDISSLLPNQQTIQEIYEPPPSQRYEPYMDFTDTIDAPITGTTLISAAVNVDTFPVHSDFLVYDIKSAFTKKPGQPLLCLKCGGDLKATPIQPSLGVRKDLVHKSDLSGNHRFSMLFNCENCLWWCLRENWKSVEKPNAIFDYLVAGGIPAVKSMAIKFNEVSNERNPEPWGKALIFRDLYDFSDPLPENWKIVFPVK